MEKTISEPSEFAEIISSTVSIPWDETLDGTAQTGLCSTAFPRTTDPESARFLTKLLLRFDRLDLLRVPFRS